jgi:hypothetical protein
MDLKSTYHLQKDYTFHEHELRIQHNEKIQGDVIFSHYGSFSQDFITTISDVIEPILLQESLPQSSVKRLFSMLIEGLQNIRKHGLVNSKGTKSGHVMIFKTNETCTISFGNYVFSSHKLFLSNYLNELKTQSKEQLKRKYLKLMRESFISTNQQTKLGLITIFMKSNVSVDFQFVNVTKDIFYFDLLVQIEIVD